ncbi:hypothetical protein SDC9_07806 [bioreactor metagenome]|uniref:Uncharacterized protein n=1 Tax=bioreactor metagenome TaxID=1076179 RepID=A0A644T8G6_9ZZZZ|nr:hypothetical protein [Candidatus Elulimicrobiales bacterium]
MSLQLLLDIGIFLINVALFTLLLAWAWKFWMLYVNTTYEKGLKYSLLEIKLPREINKSPEATEIFLRAVYDGGGLGGWYKENWEGRLPSVSSLEIVSLEGVIHFFIRAESKFKTRIEAAIYSQYPTVEIIEWPEDYTKQFPKFTRANKEGFGFGGSEWILSKKGEVETGDDKENKVFKLEYSGDMYPIKTYKDWGIDKDQKEIFKHDPLTYVLEAMGSIGAGEYMGYQIVIRDAGKWNDIYTVKKDGKDEKGKKITDLVKFETEKFTKKWSLKKKGGTEEDEWGEIKGKMVKNAEGVETFKAFEYAKDMAVSKPVSPGDRSEEAKKSLELIQRKMSKPQVIAVFRTIYVAENSSNMSTRMPMLMAITRPFNEDAGFNTFRPNTDSIPDPFDYPWQDPTKKIVPTRKEDMFGSYVGRGGLLSYSPGGMGKGHKRDLNIMLFNKPNYVKKLYSTFHNILFHPFKPTRNYSMGTILNLEELATLYHFPGEVAATPTLPRIDSVKSSSPSNLPI